MWLDYWKTIISMGMKISVDHLLAIGSYGLVFMGENLYLSTSGTRTSRLHSLLFWDESLREDHGRSFSCLAAILTESSKSHDGNDSWWQCGWLIKGGNPAGQDNKLINLTPTSEPNHCLGVFQVGEKGARTMGANKKTNDPCCLLQLPATRKCLLIWTTNHQKVSKNDDFLQLW